MRSVYGLEWAIPELPLNGFGYASPVQSPESLAKARKKLICECRKEAIEGTAVATQKACGE